MKKTEGEGAYPTSQLQSVMKGSQEDSALYTGLQDIFPSFGSLFPDDSRKIYMQKTNKENVYISGNGENLSHGCGWVKGLTSSDLEEVLRKKLTA